MLRLFVTACIAAAITGLPALAQSYQCVGGELLGGPQGYTCRTNAQGQIIAITPPSTAAPTPTTRQRMIIRPGEHTRQAPSLTTRTYTRPAPTVTTRTYTRPATTVTTRTYTRATSAAPHPPFTSTTTYSTRPAPRQSYTYTPRQPARIARPTCAKTIRKLADTPDGRSQYEVCYADLAPKIPISADLIYGRIKRAARRACRDGGLSIAFANHRCRKDAIYRAVLDANLPSLDNYYVTKTGRYVPRVIVGPLRRN